MGVGPKSPVEVDFRAGSNLSLERSRLRANDATLGVTTALEIGRSYILDRAVALDLTGDALRGGAGVRVLVRLVEGVRLVTNGGVVDIAVASDGRGESKSGSDVLHCSDVGENVRSGV